VRALESLNDFMSIIIGRGNTLDGTSVSGAFNTSLVPNNQRWADQNIIVGNNNQPAGDNSIAVGIGNKPRANTIAIGRGNVDGEVERSQTVIIDGVPTSVFTNASQARDNIVIGTNNDFGGMAQHSIAIGLNIGARIGAAFDFAYDSTINIGININPRHNSNRSINIGHSLTVQATNSINIGNGIFNTDANCVVIGRNDFSLYPSNNPRFVFGPVLGAGAGGAPNHHSIFINSNGQVYFGTNGGTAAVPTFFNTTTAVYARAYFAQTAANYNAISDQRLKSDIKPLYGDYANYLFNIRPFSYHYAFDNEKKIDWGFMAQDVRNYFPHLVNEAEDGTLSLGYMGFIPILWKINQDQQTKIDEQQARIEELERQISYILQKFGE
jgi:hypothetical protein